VKQALLALVLGVTLAGCSTGDADDPGALPTAPATAAMTTAPPTQGPTSGAAVPTGAFIAPVDLGPGWTTAPAATTPCAPAFARTAFRRTGFAEERGTLTETLATGVDVSAAVAAWRQSLEQCGYDVRDDALGDASITARTRDGSDAVVVTGTEGVLIVLHAHGPLAQAHDEMDGWADLALGTSCVAAPDGCH
jgi:hypothetical protein